MFIREKIIDHLKWSNIFEKVPQDIIDNKETIVEKYGISSEEYHKRLEKKVEIKNKKEQYINIKHEIDQLFSTELNINNDTYLNQSNYMILMSKVIGIPNQTIKAEYTKYKESIITYKYNDYVSSPKVFTYNDEFSLLEKLYIWEQESQDCTCQACVLENIFLLAYILANINKLKPEIWKKEIIHGNWICEFEMRHSQEISKFSKYSECKKISAPQLLASSDKINVVELNTSSTIGPQSNLQFNNVSYFIL